MATPSDPIFAGHPVSPKRISGMLVVSGQLLKQAPPDLDAILTSDISRQLASYFDSVALYGTGPADNQPMGLASLPGVIQGAPFAQRPDWHSLFFDLERTIEDTNVEMDSYGVLVSPGTKKILRTSPSFSGGSITTWSELTNPQSSPRSPMADVSPAHGII
jgi:hypothetical protein